MSYDVSLHYGGCEHCGRPAGPVELQYESPTYNYGQMFRLCDRMQGGSGYSLDAINGLKGHEAARWLRAVLTYAVENEDFVRDRQPRNGWGSYESFVKLLRHYLKVCREHPNATWQTSGASTPGVGQTCSGRRIEQ